MEKQIQKKSEEMLSFEAALGAMLLMGIVSVYLYAGLCTHADDPIASKNIFYAFMFCAFCATAGLLVALWETIVHLICRLHDEIYLWRIARR